MTALLPRAIVGDPSAWHQLLAFDPAAVVEVAEQHGVLPLMHERSRRSEDASHPLVDALRTRTTAHVARDLLTVDALGQALDALATAGICPLLLKGVDLALSVYPRSDLRPRLDSDLLVDVSMRAAAGRALSHLGYRIMEHVGGDLLMYQQSFVLERHGVPIHAIDLHWRIANPQRFGSVLTFDELAAAAEPRLRLGSAARGLARVHALLLACVHRVAHHFDDPRLIWTYDLHLLAQHMDSDDWNAFVTLAIDREVAAVCARGLALACGQFGTPVPVDTMRALEAQRGRERGQDMFLALGQRHIRRVMSDLAHLPSWKARARLARQHVFPSPHYMRDVYAPASHAPLVLLYARRVWRGARRWMERS